MNILKNFDKLNTLYSYNIFAFSCIFATILFLIPLFYPSIISAFINNSDNVDNKLLIAYMFWNIFFSIFILVTFVVFLLEKLLKWSIKQDFILNNKYIKHFRNLCAFISLFFLIILICLILYIGINSLLVPSDLIHYNILVK